MLSGKWRAFCFGRNVLMHPSVDEFFNGPGNGFLCDVLTINWTSADLLSVRSLETKQFKTYQWNWNQNKKILHGKSISEIIFNGLA